MTPSASEERGAQACLALEGKRREPPARLRVRRERLLRLRRRERPWGWLAL